MMNAKPRDGEIAAGMFDRLAVVLAFGFVAIVAAI
jgi:hypothetical protein